MRIISGSALAVSALAAATVASAQDARPASAPPQAARANVNDPAGYPLLQIGEIVPRTTEEAKAQGDQGIFSIGLETIERGYVSYQAVAPYISPLGFGRARLMAGWANIERKRGVYDFSQIRAIVADLRSKGVTPWVGLTYGNPQVYGPGAGGETLGDQPPTSPEGRTAWIAFVEATVRELGKDSAVTEWEIWNEPNHNFPVEIYAPFAVETVNAITRVQPGATIDLGAFVGPAYTMDDPRGLPYVAATLKLFKERTNVAPGRVKVTYHPYSTNPDSSYNATFDAFRKLVASYGYAARQGENGAPSGNQQTLALRNEEWTEDGQAKYALRRLVSDFAMGIETGYFGIAEMHYPQAIGGKSDTEWRYSKNLKGVLQTGRYTGIAPDYGDKRVVRPKEAYRALQNLAAVFDRTVAPLDDAGCQVPEGYRVFAFRKIGAAGTKTRHALAVWRATDRPGDYARAVPITITCAKLPLGTPRADGSVADVQLTNLLTANVYRVNSPVAHLVRTGPAFRYDGVRVTDSPVLIGDDGFVRYE